MAKKQPKPANDKRAALPKRVDYGPVFKKSWERYKRAGRHDMNEARDVMGMLWHGEPLPPEYLDHELTGDWADHRDCHIRGDFLLIYKVTKTDVVFVDIGTHAELFK
jgi:mRNA interferase YafQ